MATISQLPTRPSELICPDEDETTRLLWDIAIIENMEMPDLLDEEGKPKAPSVKKSVLNKLARLDKMRGVR